MIVYDSLVIGGGPAGMTAALYLLRSGWSTALVERLAPGGQMLSTEAIENYPGFPEAVKGWELADRLHAQLAPYSPVYINDTVQAIEAHAALYAVKIGTGWIKAKSLVICSGAGHRKLKLPNEEKFTGRGISYCAVCDGNFFKDQIVAVAGGGNSALEEALYLARLVRKLYLIHRRDAFRADKIFQNKILALPDKIELILNTVITGINGENDLQSLSLHNVLSKEDRELKVDGLFIFVGNVPHGEYLPSELTCDTKGFIITDTEMRTNLPGIFAAGDIRSKLCRQVASAVGDGATAAHAASIYLEQLHA